MNDLKSPITVQWEVTPLCNHNCIHCYNYWSDKKSSSRFLLNTSDFYSETIKEIIKNKVMRVIVTGGEPLIVFDKVYPYLRELKDHNIIVAINSNLTLLTPPMAKKIKDLDINILTSIPSYDPKTTMLITNSPKAFLQTQRGVRLAHKYKITVIANMVVTKINLKQIFETAQYAKSLEINYFGATKACKPINSLDFSDYALTLDESRLMFNEIIRAKKKLRLNVDSFTGYPACLFNSDEMIRTFVHRQCLAGKTTCTVGFTGDIRACPHTAKVYGNIQCGLKNAWDNMAEWRNNDLVPKQCSSCKLKVPCSGGCKVEALTHFESLNLPDPYADFTNSIDKYSKKRFVYKNIKATNLRVSKKTVYREEEFGGLLFNGNYVQVNHNLYKFLSKNIGNAITVNNIAKILRVNPDKAKLTYSYLAQNKFLI